MQAGIRGRASLIRRFPGRSGASRSLAVGLALVALAALARPPSAPAGAGAAPAPSPGAAAPASPPRRGWQAPEVVSAEELVRRAAGDQPLDLSAVTVDGDVDLAGLGRVAHPLRCTDCRFTGGFRARDVVFERLVDLNGAVVSGAVDLEGADFRDRASFERATFEAPVSLVATRFADRTSFSGAEFREAARFDRALFGAGASLAGGAAAASFARGASFQGVEFGGESDFGGRRFLGPASFVSAIFTGRVSFALATFAGPARFEDCVARSGAAFRVAQFLGEASFARCRGEGAFEFEGGLFGRGASFHSLATAGPLVLNGIRVAAGRDLDLERVSAGGLVMDVPLVEAVRGPAVRERVLTKIEAGALARGDLRTANDARYRFLLSRSRQARGPARVVDGVLYRGIGGYLVRPLHPLATFVVLLVVGTAVRSLASAWPVLRPRLRRRHRTSSPKHEARREEPEPAGPRLLKATVMGLAAFQRTVKAAFSPKPAISVDNPESPASYFVAGLRWAEFLGFKVLTAVFLVTLASSNATSRQMLDALRG